MSGDLNIVLGESLGWGHSLPARGTKFLETLDLDLVACLCALEIESEIRGLLRETQFLEFFNSLHCGRGK